MRILILQLVHSLALDALILGISKEKLAHEWQALNFVVVGGEPSRRQSQIGFQLSKQIGKIDDYGDLPVHNVAGTDLILLNLSPLPRRIVRPPALQCSLPHFIDRLERDLQGNDLVIQAQLRQLWSNYERGQPCSTLVAEQLRILQQHNISPESFNIPPASVFRRYALVRKLKKANKILVNYTLSSYTVVRSLSPISELIKK
ncbi:hypothetical protein KIN20_002016 [Parelaphostrongylus tenuis]|uniref:Uncharacterized protein n=1 Tax=Parelaphostrongylus tenuis TaxID=148309 RepID=A0AAD5LXV1_PARTN|nr:hypothetical protein KIN20_002016 [Parelaphostrongylus tenuis]